MKYLVLSLAMAVCTALGAQTPGIRLVTPSGNNNKVTAARQFITGVTCKTCRLTINETEVKVYGTGAFAYRVDLKEGDTSFVIKTDNGAKTAEQTVSYSYKAPPPPKPTDSFYFESIQVSPEGNLVMLPGDVMRIRIKTKPGCMVKLNNAYTIPELPAADAGGMTGIYQYNYQFKLEDSLLLSRLKFSLYKDGIRRAEAQSKQQYTVSAPENNQVGITRSAWTPVNTGLGEDRLGGAKTVFLDSAVRLLVTGRADDQYRVQLNRNLSAWVPMNYVSMLPAGTSVPQSLTQNIRATGDSMYDYVQVELFQKLPYTSYQEIDPSRIIVDVYGATSNTNWLVQYPETLKEITDVYYRQVEDGLLRVIIQLKHKAQWGYRLYYNGNTLVVRVRRPKEKMRLDNMVVAVDAGHGGSNTGARGITGAYEKDFTLAVAKKLQTALTAAGAKVIMTRESDISFENNDRLRLLHRRQPDFAISIHLNSAGDPLRVKGTSTYYKHIGFKNLARHLYGKMTETGLPGWGLIGNFNFFLNSTTEFPTALVETLFLSHPEEEEKMYSPDFQQLMADKIVEGVKEWLKECAADDR